MGGKKVHFEVRARDHEWSRCHYRSRCVPIGGRSGTVVLYRWTLGCHSARPTGLPLQQCPVVASACWSSAQAERSPWPAWARRWRAERPRACATAAAYSLGAIPTRLIRRVALPSARGHRGCPCGCGVPVAVLDGRVRAGAEQRCGYGGGGSGGSRVLWRAPAGDGGTVVGTGPPRPRPDRPKARGPFVLCFGRSARRRRR